MQYREIWNCHEDHLYVAAFLGFVLGNCNPILTQIEKTLVALII